MKAIGFNVINILDEIYFIATEKMSKCILSIKLLITIDGN